MKIDNIKTGLKRASAVALATMSMCPSFYAEGNKCNKKTETLDIVGILHSGSMIGLFAGLGTIAFIETLSRVRNNRFKQNIVVPDEVQALYKKYRNSTQDKNELALIDAIYDYFEYSLKHAFVKLEVISAQISEKDFEKFFKKSKEYQCFGKLSLVDQELLKKNFKGYYGNVSANKSFIYQIGYTANLLKGVISSSEKNNLVSYKFAKDLSSNGIGDAIKKFCEDCNEKI